MNPGRQDCARGGDRGAQGKKNQNQTGENFSRNDTPESAPRTGGLHHISHALERIRYSLAKTIAPRDMVFNHDMSLVLDKLQAENEELRAQLMGVS